MTVKFGSNYLGSDRCEFTVWAPTLQELSVLVVSQAEERLIPMQPVNRGYWNVTADGIAPGTRYFYQIENSLKRPDPASHFQPDGVHSASQVVDRGTFSWTDRSWSGIPLEHMVIYELHVGTFTPEGTFSAIIPRLGILKDLGINAIELMPIAQFPGDRNWGYDGVYPYAVQNSYGTPDQLKQLVNSCHQLGIAVILDVVYNHLGPEGNYMRDFGPYFTAKYRPIWGDAINYDDEYSDGVREFFLSNALYWLETYHIDALRLDAIQAIFEVGARPLLQELADRVEEFSQQQGRQFYLTAESDLNDPRVLRPKPLGGYGINAQWCDDFHHGLHVLLTGESQAYYQDYGKCEHLAKSYREGFAYTGEYSAFRKRRFGASSEDEPADRFIVFAQNHDQVGYRIMGDRLSTLVSFEALKLAAGAVLLSPFIPLLFMGEEYGDRAPFCYFISHSEPPLIQAIRQEKEAEFQAAGSPGEFPDPAGLKTFYNCKLNWNLRQEEPHQQLWKFYQHLIQLRRSIPALKKLDKNRQTVDWDEKERWIVIQRWDGESRIFLLMNFNEKTVVYPANMPEGHWQKRLDSAAEKWMGSGSSLPESLAPGATLTLTPHSVVLYERVE
jgi:maltooligosyltrehalose trehalohydrolase